jgi:hypothetical protein
MKTMGKGWTSRVTAAAVLVGAGLAPVVAVGPAAAGTPVPGTPNCQMFPSDNVWNTDISGLPVDPYSAAWLSSMSSATTNLHPDFGPSGDPSAPYGIPYTVVSSLTPKVFLTFDYAGESDPGPYPFSASTPIEGGTGSTGDRHAIMVNPSTCTLYELYDASTTRPDRQRARGPSGTSTRTPAPGGMDIGGRRRPADPAGSLRYDEVLSGSSPTPSG